MYGFVKVFTTCVTFELAHNYLHSNALLADRLPASVCKNSKLAVSHITFYCNKKCGIFRLEKLIFPTPRLENLKTKIRTRVRDVSIVCQL